jgi:alpha-beta hydrolase superfamily lysophospholipase
MKSFARILFAFALSAFAVSSADASICTASWKGARDGSNDCTLREMMVHNQRVSIRMGYLEENLAVPFKGNIIFYQGLADSMLNHAPLFDKLTGAGYRVIAFDYMGQGGSSGTMNDTRIAEIGDLGKVIWKLYARDLTLESKMTILGWSTGGLAAYAQARRDKDVKTLILIAPGLVPGILVGEQHPLQGQIDLITVETLTSARYEDGTFNPHVDPVRPRSPLLIPAFAVDLQKVALFERLSYLPKRVQGLVLLSSENDSYVNSNANRTVLKLRAPQLELEQYPNTLHELDNETEPTASQVHQDILDFLERSF